MLDFVTRSENPTEEDGQGSSKAKASSYTGRNPGIEATTAMGLAIVVSRKSSLCERPVKVDFV